MERFAEFTEKLRNAFEKTVLKIILAPSKEEVGGWKKIKN
jgi:hypothetical protein